jgi:hypothetical protein
VPEASAPTGYLNRTSASEDSLITAVGTTMLAVMSEQVVLLVIGFGLTSVLGGALGLFFQTRSWTHQHRAQQRDQEREQAIKVFEEVSSLLDKRLYRMRQLFWAAKRRAGAGTDGDGVDQAREEYRHVVATWNDNLNRILALVQTYFGGAARHQLEDNLYEEFSAIGRALERFVRDVAPPKFEGDETPPIDARLRWLGRQVYAFNVGILSLLQEDRLGRDAPAQPPAQEYATPLLQFGNAGPAVSRLQRALQRAGMFEARIDGSFGKDTEAAVRQLQRSAGLAIDGVVGLGTWKALPSNQIDVGPEDVMHGEKLTPAGPAS